MKYKFSPEYLTRMMNHLNNLSLSTTGLIEIPETIKELKINVLSACGNKIEKIPNWISEIKSLRGLNLKINKITEIPEELTTLSQLISLNLVDNQIETIPKSISRLDNLKELYLDYNNIKELPESISELKSLKHLSVNDNQLTRIPISLCRLIKEKQIRMYLGNNPLQQNDKGVALNEEYTYIGEINNFKPLDIELIITKEQYL